MLTIEFVKTGRQFSLFKRFKHKNPIAAGTRKWYTLCREESC